MGRGSNHRREFSTRVGIHAVSAAVRTPIVINESVITKGQLYVVHLHTLELRCKVLPKVVRKPSSKIVFGAFENQFNVQGGFVGTAR